MGNSNRWKTGKSYTDYPTESVGTADLAWAAGVYEGEGSCAYGAGSEAARIGQKDTWLLYRLKALFGGSVHLSETSVWQIYGAKARGFLQSIYGLLSPRRQKQIRAVLFQGLRSPIQPACKRGHPFTPENVYMYRGNRNCRECGREALARYRGQPSFGEVIFRAIHE